MRNWRKWPNSPRINHCSIIDRMRFVCGWVSWLGYCSEKIGSFWFPSSSNVMSSSFSKYRLIFSKLNCAFYTFSFQVEELTQICQQDIQGLNKQIAQLQQFRSAHATGHRQQDSNHTSVFEGLFWVCRRNVVSGIQYRRGSDIVLTFEQIWFCEST